MFLGLTSCFGCKRNVVKESFGSDWASGHGPGTSERMHVAAQALAKSASRLELRSRYDFLASGVLVMGLPPGTATAHALDTTSLAVYANSAAAELFSVPHPAGSSSPLATARELLSVLRKIEPALVDEVRAHLLRFGAADPAGHLSLYLPSNNYPNPGLPSVSAAKPSKDAAVVPTPPPRRWQHAIVEPLYLTANPPTSPVQRHAGAPQNASLPGPASPLYHVSQTQAQAAAATPSEDPDRKPLHRTPASIWPAVVVTFQPLNTPPHTYRGPGPATITATAAAMAAATTATATSEAAAATPASEAPAADTGAASAETGASCAATGTAATAALAPHIRAPDSRRNLTDVPTRDASASGPTGYSPQQTSAAAPCCDSSPSPQPTGGPDMMGSSMLPPLRIGPSMTGFTLTDDDGSRRPLQQLVIRGQYGGLMRSWTGPLLLPAGVGVEARAVAGSAGGGGGGATNSAASPQLVADWARLREGMVLGGLTPIVTAFTTNGRAVLYQNSMSIMYYGVRPCHGVATPGVRHDDTTASQVSELHYDSILSELFNMEPTKLDRMLTEVCIEGRVWKGLVQVPASCLPAGMSFHGGEAPSSSRKLQPQSSRIFSSNCLTPGVSGAVHTLAPAYTTIAEDLRSPTAPVARLHSLGRQVAAGSMSPVLGTDAATVEAAASEGLCSSLLNTAMSGTEEPTTLGEGTGQKFSSMLEPDPLATSTWGLLIDIQDTPASSPQEPRHRSVAIGDRAPVIRHHATAALSFTRADTAFPATRQNSALPACGPDSYGPAQPPPLPVSSKNVPQGDLAAAAEGPRGHDSGANVHPRAASFCCQPSSPFCSPNGGGGGAVLPAPRVPTLGGRSFRTHGRRSSDVMLGCAEWRPPGDPGSPDPGGPGADVNACSAGAGGMLGGQQQQRLRAPGSSRRLPRRCISRQDLAGGAASQSFSRVVAFASSLKTAPTAVQQAMQVTASQGPGGGVAAIGMGSIAGAQSLDTSGRSSFLTTSAGTFATALGSPSCLRPEGLGTATGMELGGAMDRTGTAAAAEYGGVAAGRRSNSFLQGTPTGTGMVTTLVPGQQGSDSSQQMSRSFPRRRSEEGDGSGGGGSPQAAATAAAMVAASGTATPGGGGASGAAAAQSSRPLSATTVGMGAAPAFAIRRLSRKLLFAVKNREGSGLLRTQSAASVPEGTGASLPLPGGPARGQPSGSTSAGQAPAMRGMPANKLSFAGSGPSPSPSPGPGPGPGPVAGRQLLWARRSISRNARSEVGVASGSASPAAGVSGGGVAVLQPPGATSQGTSCGAMDDVGALLCGGRMLGGASQRPAAAAVPASSQRTLGVGYSWHEVTASRVTDPVTGQYAIVVTQVDVTAKVEAERHLAFVTEAEHRLLEQIFPRHVLAYMTEEGGPWAAPHPGPGPQRAPSHPAGWRPVVRDINKLATSHREVTLLFADIQGFTPMCKVLEPRVVMAFLNDLFTRFDQRLDEFGVYKVETIGDCYFVAGGLIGEDEEGMPAVRARDSNADPLHAEKVLMFAKAMLSAASQTSLPTTGEPVRMRIGIHSGPVVSGVVGQRMPRFCLFGDTVNTTSRMESTGVPGCIHASEDARRLLRNEVWVPTGGIEVKGKGLMNTYLWAPPDAESQAILARHTAYASDTSRRSVHQLDGSGGRSPPLQLHQLRAYLVPGAPNGSSAGGNGASGQGQGQRQEGPASCGGFRHVWASLDDQSNNGNCEESVTGLAKLLMAGGDQ